METCSVCGYNIIPGDSFCTNCGVRHNRTPAQASPDAYAHTATAAAARSQLAAADLYQPPTQARPAPAGLATPEDQPGQTIDGWPPPSVAGNATHAPKRPGRRQVSSSRGHRRHRAVLPRAMRPWPLTRLPRPARLQRRPGTTLRSLRPSARTAARPGPDRRPAPFCGQVWGLPKGIMLSSAGRRFGGYLSRGSCSSAHWGSAGSSGRSSHGPADRRPQSRCSACASSG